MLPVFVHIECLKVCKGMRLTKCCRQSSSPTRMPLDWAWRWMRDSKQLIVLRNLLIRRYTMEVNSTSWWVCNPLEPQESIRMLLYYPQQDLPQQSGRRQRLCAHSIGRQIIASSDCGTCPKVSISTLRNPSSKYSIVTCLLIGKSTVRSWRVGCYSSDQPIMCLKQSL